jgi:hypothetical protein
MNPDVQRELLAFQEKICLAELEESKAHQRVKEIEFQKARYSMDMFVNSMKEAQAAAAAQPVPPKDK